MENKLSERLRVLRKSAFMSVTDVVKLLKENGLDYSEQSIYKWEQGNAIPSVNTLHILARIYQCNFSYLIADDDVQFKKISDKDLSILRHFRKDFLFRNTISQLIRLIDRQNS